MKKLSIGIVTYNNKDEIQSLLNSIYDYTIDLDFDVFISDNNSTDDTVKLIKENYPLVHVIENKSNKGFGAGHNQIINTSSAEIHAIVNPDISFNTNIFKELCDYLDDNKDVAMVTPKILNEDGTEQHLPKLKPKIKYLLGGRFEKRAEIFKKWRSEYTMRDREINEPIDIDFCTGCFMVVRNDILKKIEGFDDRFFMYFEDVDLARRVKKFGRVVFNPNFYVTHKWSRAAAKSLKFLKIEVSSMFKYFFKWGLKG